MQIHDFIQIGDGETDICLSVERRAGRMPVTSVHVADVDGIAHLAWVSSDGEEEGVSLRSDPVLLARIQSVAGVVLVEFEEAGIIESSAQVVRAEPMNLPRERCYG